MAIHECHTPEQLARYARNGYRDVEDACLAFASEMAAMKAERDKDGIYFDQISALCNDARVLLPPDSPLLIVIDQIDELAHAGTLGIDIEEQTPEPLHA